jgi:hypothetical protein
MRRENQSCGNEKCRTSATPLWRKGWTTKEGKSVMLCNACGLHYKKGHFCQFCHQIYKESESDDKENPWIGCERCKFIFKNKNILKVQDGFTNIVTKKNLNSKKERHTTAQNVEFYH